MSMNYSIELRKIIYKAVVSISCGQHRGTAFFISQDTLLTARHVIADYALHKQPIIIHTDKDVLCKAEELGNIGENLDIAILKCVEYTQSEYLKLLSAVFNEGRELTIVGYPREFGNCSELISLSVQDRLGNQEKDYDTTVVRTDTLAFTSYKGFSGAPVLNEKGSVIGITIIQYGSCIGYSSVKSLTEKLEKIGIEVNKDWQSEDFSPLGRGTSQIQVKKAISYAALRYNRDLHVANATLDAEIDLFALRKNRTDIEKELNKIEQISLNDLVNCKDCLVNYQNGNYEDLFDRLNNWNKNNPKTDSLTTNFFQVEFHRLSLLLRKLAQSKKQIILLRGNAGMGKTHYVCATAERLCRNMNVYLLFGSWFEVNRDFETQLYEMMDIADKDLRKLNDKMIETNTNALIIIDALNEGATNIFWNIAINRLITLLKDCDRIKLLITYRDNDGIKLNISCNTINLTGFDDNTYKAIRKYFNYYQIDDSTDELKTKFQTEFNEPLFLSIFCIVAHQNIRYLINDFTYSSLFRQYIRYRNNIVSKGVDEDPHRNITEKALMKFASYSLYYNGCNGISREKARCYTEQICKYRTWSNSLLNWLLKENLMLSIGHEGMNLMFGYQKMGDFLMADVFANNKMTKKGKIDFILDKGCKRDDDSYKNFIVALLSEWELTPELLEREQSKNMYSLILDSLKLYGKNNQVILKWIQKNKIYSPQILRKNFHNLSLEVFMSAHNCLKKHELISRDKKWTIMVNKEYSNRYDIPRLDMFINIVPKEEKNEEWCKIVILLSWICTSPHPYLRAKVLRKLVGIFDKNPSMALFAISEFFDCNDPYVVQVVTCAIYGHLLRSRDAKLGSDIAEMILQFFYKDHKAPEDILVRQWTMQILLFVDELNHNSNYLKNINPPFDSQNPFALIIDGPGKINENYFGTSKGSNKMYVTLYGRLSDFNRYIIGTNNRKDSEVFLKKEDGLIKGIPLTDIVLLIANIAKHNLKWDDELGKHDDNVFSESRYNNPTERFGKKYLWLALYKADALLSDHLKVVDGSRYVYSPQEKDIVSTPYPWYTKESSKIDPSVLNSSETLPYTGFNIEAMETVKTVTNERWMAKDFPIQKPRLIVTDKDDSRWIVLTCYDGYTTNAEEDTQKDLFLFSNAAFVKNEELNTFKEWAKEQNFYGRWMPEQRNGSTEYLWNEYPWADTYKRTIRNMGNYSNSYKGKTFTLLLSYETQLQEEWMGMDENEVNLKEVSMPNYRMMKALGLYTAERGVVREITTKSVVSTNFAIGKMNGLAMREDYLNKYLSDNQLSLVFYSLGEKYVNIKGNYQIIGPRHDLSGAYCYENGLITEIQPMHISNTL